MNSPDIVVQSKAKMIELDGTRQQIKEHLLVAVVI